MKKSLTALTLAAAAAAGCAHGARRSAPPTPAPAPAAVPSPKSVPAGRTAEEIVAGLERSKHATPYFPLLSDADAHKAMPSLFRGRPVPNLARVAALQPRSMEAVLASSRQIHTEGDLDVELLNDVFWAVSSSNECFY